jgi:hypothetical protein
MKRAVTSSLTAPVRRVPTGAFGRGEPLILLQCVREARMIGTVAFEAASMP